MPKGQWGGGRPRRWKEEDGPVMHIRLGIPKKHHDILKTLAKYRGLTTLGYVRALVMHEIRRFQAGKQVKSVKDE
jgi:hypothetical protein